VAAVRSAIEVICSRTTFGPSHHALPVPADASTDCGKDGRLLAQFLDRPAKPPERRRVSTKLDLRIHHTDLHTVHPAMPS